ncbi:MAG: PfkB family carbohydrate kinase [Oscillospiraceae bacterium]
MKKILVGFDGSIDKIAHPVKEKKNDGSAVYFKTISDFSAYLSTTAHKSAEIEIDIKSIKLGGNAPIMANSIANLGNKVVCAATLGDISSPMYDEFKSNVEIINLGDVPECTAFEFDDGKLMFSNLLPLNKLTYQNILTVVSKEKLLRLLSDSDLIALVDWSNGDNMTQLWQNILETIKSTGHKPKLFFDFADPYRRTQTEKQNVFAVIKAYTDVFETCLGMNLNEASHFANALGIAATQPEQYASEIAHKMQATVVIHTAEGTYAANDTVKAYARVDIIKNPKALTGAGDHFNAGFCHAFVHEKTLQECIEFGNRNANFFIKNAFDATQETIQTLM